METYQTFKQYLKQLKKENMKKKLSKLTSKLSCQLVWSAVCLLFIFGSIMIYLEIFKGLKRLNSSEPPKIDSVMFGGKKYKVLEHKDGLLKIKEGRYISDKFAR